MFIYVFEGRNSGKTAAVVGVTPRQLGLLQDQDHIASLELYPKGKAALGRAEVVGFMCCESLEQLRKRLGDVVAVELFACDLNAPGEPAPGPPLSCGEDMMALIESEDQKAVRLALTRDDVEHIAAITARGEMYGVGALSVVTAEGHDDTIVMLQVFETAEDRARDAQGFAERHQVAQFEQGAIRHEGQA